MNKIFLKTKNIARSNSKTTKVVLFSLVFGLIGFLMVFITKAASPYSVAELESAVLSSGAHTMAESSASGGSSVMFSNQGHGGSNNCTPGVGVLGIMGPCINSSLIPSPKPGVSTARFYSVEPKPLYPPVQWNTGNGEPGAFRTRCDYSHMNFDDPVLFYNQPNAAHLHTYFGNTESKAGSTSASLLNFGNSTCSGGTFNRSAYWIPSMVDTANGRPIAPNDDRSLYNSDLEIYYKVGYQGVGYRDLVPFPNGLQMIAGNPASGTTPPSPARNGEFPVTYYCESSLATDRARQDEGTGIPICTSGEVLVMDIDFPQCWDGQNLRSANGRSHVEYGRWGGNEDGTTPISENRGCPPSHPVGMPHVEMFVRWRVPPGTDTRNWRLSSDNYTNSPGGYSGHADYVFAWDPSAFPTLKERCYVTQQDCGYQLGDGRELFWIRFW